MCVRLVFLIWIVLMGCGTCVLIRFFSLRYRFRRPPSMKCLVRGRPVCQVYSKLDGAAHPAGKNTFQCPAVITHSVWKGIISTNRRAMGVRILVRNCSAGNFRQGGSEHEALPVWMMLVYICCCVQSAVMASGGVPKYLFFKRLFCQNMHAPLLSLPAFAHCQCTCYIRCFAYYRLSA